ncbi:hypothetical protein GCM10010946_23710 [Undibacterium squillarum]|uniref:Uncharacterized protein n=1 Tax=Undibacterium squillarum TaxID=1131567 RepID=A0ABQ2Y002_9BURK|nr:hypothetical protein GCM10010946_23710 [Undibacterium squillarum]
MIAAFLLPAAMLRHPDYAAIRIRHFRRAGLSADDRRIAVQNTAFNPFLGSFAPY